MTYEEFCKRIDEELSTGDFIRFAVSNATLSSLLSQETKITVVNQCIYFGIESEEKLYQLMAANDPTAFDGTVCIMLTESPAEWWIITYKTKYDHCEHLSLAIKANTPLRQVTL